MVCYPNEDICFEEDLEIEENTVYKKGKEIIEKEEAFEYAVLNTFNSQEGFEEFLEKYCYDRNSEREIYNLFFEPIKKKREQNQKEFVEWFFSGEWQEVNKKEIESR